MGLADSHISRTLPRPSSPLRGGPTRGEAPSGVGGEWPELDASRLAPVHAGALLVLSELGSRPPPGSAFGRVRPPRKGEGEARSHVPASPSEMCECCSPNGRG